MQHLTAFITSLNNQVAEQSKLIETWKDDNMQKVLVVEGKKQEMVDETGRRALSLSFELEGKMEGATPGLLGNLESKLVARVDKI